MTQVVLFNVFNGLIVGAFYVLMALGVAMTHAGLILALPRMYATLQFSFRLESFVLLGVSAAIVAARRGEKRESVDASARPSGRTNKSARSVSSAQ